METPLKLGLVIAFSVLSAILYRLGGASGYDTKYRDAGCSATALILYILLGGLNFAFWWAYLATFGLSWATMTTYYKKKGSDAKWWNWLLVGLGFSLCYLPLVYVSHLWLGFTIRTILTTIGVMAWSEWQGNVVWEECGRGAIFTATIPLLFI